MLLSPTGLKYHTMLFTRSSNLSSMLAVVEAASKFHDEILGKNRSFHLFRLPVTIEQELHRYYLSEEPALEDLSKDQALRELQDIAGPGNYGSEGPTQIGERKQINSRKGLTSLAGHYARIQERC